jgi:hypothetical protein
VNLNMHPAYARLVELAARSHQSGRATHGIGQADADLARLYCYGFRPHTIGAFHATRMAVNAQPAGNPLAMACRERALEQLEDLINLAMDPVPDDARAVVSTFHRYDRGVRRAIAALWQDHQACGQDPIARIARRFQQVIEQITASNGIVLTRDTAAPEQASYLVPNLGITIVPLVYGDYHSWNLAWLPQPRADVPRHRHHAGVEIHLGYAPLHGYTILADCKAEVREGYAMPIPPMTDHAYASVSNAVHHVPFIFGSMMAGGWGVFLDVEPRPYKLDELETVPIQSRQMNGTAWLQREIDRAAALPSARRWPIILAGQTHRDHSGGLDLCVARVTAAGLAFPIDLFRIVSIVRGEGLLTIGNNLTARLGPHDHFGIPAGMTATIAQNGPEPMVVLDAIIRPDPSNVPARLRSAQSLA